MPGADVATNTAASCSASTSTRYRWPRQRTTSVCWPWTRPWGASRPLSRGRRSSSSCGPSPACTSTRRRRCSASRPARRTAGGPMRGPGSASRSRGKKRSRRGAIREKGRMSLQRPPCPEQEARVMNEATIFAAALEKATDEERAALVAQACGGDERLRRRVEALLRAHAEADDLLDPPSRTDRTEAYAPHTGAPGTVIGPYKLVERVGEGGMGEVWMAQQAEPVKRLVALKLIKAGMGSRQVIARFEAERQALALMDHPNIARGLDAGTTGAGRPYFVMDLVRGVPITKYCDEHHLTPRQRLELFVPVCQAVQHAHQKGVIHRDLKPSNVLVAPYDGRPVPKVIDFG